MASPDPVYNRRYLEWKYEQNPFIRDPLIALVKDGNEVVGMRGLFGTRWTLGASNNSIVLPHADDLVIHPAHRGRGLFIPMNDLLIEMARDMGYSLLISLCGGLTTQELSLVAGWTDVGDLQRLYRGPSRSPLFLPFRAIRRGARWLRAAGSPAQSTLRVPTDSMIDAIVSRVARRSPSRVTVRRPEEWPGVDRIRTDRGGLTHVRSADFWRWRLANPDRVYRVLSLKDHNGDAFAILSWSSPSSFDVSIAEIGGSSLTALDLLLRALTSHRRLHLQIMEATQPEDTLDIALGAGFEQGSVKKSPPPRRRFLLQRTGIDEPGWLEASVDDISSWHVSLIDTMGA